MDIGVKPTVLVAGGIAYARKTIKRDMDKAIGSQGDHDVEAFTLLFARVAHHESRRMASIAS